MITLFGWNYEKYFFYGKLGISSNIQDFARMRRDSQQMSENNLEKSILQKYFRSRWR